MGKITIEKPIAQQGHSLSVNITRVCHTYGIKRGDMVSVTIEHDLIPEQVQEETKTEEKDVKTEETESKKPVDSELTELE